MGEYAYTVICAAICTAIIVSLSPDSESGIGKYIAFAAALVTAIAMLMPLTSLLKGADFRLDIKESEKAEKSYEYFAEGAATILSSLYGVDREALSAKITESDSGELKSITLTVSEGINVTEASKLLSDIYGVNIEIEEANCD